MNYFTLFSLPEQYDINVDMLRQRYELLQRVTHPDKYASASDQEKRMYMQKNAEVNDGFHVLNSPVLRGEHLLSVRNIPLANEQDTIGDTDFLMQQMELREELASAQTVEDFLRLERSVSEMHADYIDRINLLLHANEEDKSKQAGIELSKLKFLIKLASEVKSNKQFAKKS